MEYIVIDVDALMLFTKYCNYYNITTIFISQNVFMYKIGVRDIAFETPKFASLEKMTCVLGLCLGKVTESKMSGCSHQIL